jgi:predicted nucleic acid-binding protein
MIPKNRSVFLDTSVVFAAVLSESGGARKLFYLGEVRVLHLLIGPNVLRECDEVVRRKAPTSLSTLAQLLAIGRVETTASPTKKEIALARTYVAYEPDAYVLAETMQSNAGWLITHDKEHFLKAHKKWDLPFLIGTPGDLLQSLKEDFTIP